ncbi:MAG: hypothetical protein HN922_00595 [Anaerolineae bacterium]|jgi:hypothetical protein|nr:hypothetical protein [Anaerolineae bacterium]MBT7990525.1 hypothetical protein [Anaerolineae bacterium]
MMLLSFDLPVEMTIPTGAVISIIYWSPQYGRWIRLETVRTESGRVVAATNFFGTFTVTVH